MSTPDLIVKQMQLIARDGKSLVLEKLKNAKLILDTR
jgi:hypothetical protein